MKPDESARVYKVKFIMILGEKVGVTAIHSDKSKKGLMMKKVERKEGVMSGGCDALELNRFGLRCKANKCSCTGTGDFSVLLW